MDDDTRNALEAIAACASDADARKGPVSLSEEYLRAVDAAERLPANRSGSDKTWTERALADWFRDIASVRRVPGE